MASESQGQIGVTIGICAYNEEQNIGNLLQALVNQKTEVARIDEILVVASGCTDRTPEIVEGFQNGHKQVHLVVERERRGKASAINEILRRAQGEVVIMEGADTIPDVDAIELLAGPFADPLVGVVAAHPISTDDENSFWGGLAHALWDIHHEVSLKNPKTGEMFAFRRLLEGLPEDVGADEDWIRHKIESNGYRVAYVPEARVYNAGPKSVDEFLKQRIRINTQQLFQRRVSSFVPPTWRTEVVGSALLSYLQSERAKPAHLLALLAFEMMARVYSGATVALSPRNIVTWEPLPSTKFVVRPEDAGDGEEDEARRSVR